MSHNKTSTSDGANYANDNSIVEAQLSSQLRANFHFTCILCENFGCVVDHSVDDRLRRKDIVDESGDASDQEGPGFEGSFGM